MLSFIYIILTLSVKIILYLFLLLTVLLIALKVFLEPVKGVCRCTNRLDGKVALVTGGNSGLGLETARELARRGATVVIASRDVGKSRAAVADIAASTGSARVSCRRLDLASFTSVRDFAEDFNKTVDRLDLLVNNAGCGGLKLKNTVDGIDIVTQINYFSAFLLTNLLLDKLIASKPSRIVIVSSIGHRFVRFNPNDLTGVKLNKRRGTLVWWWLYARSKLYQVMWTKELAKRLPAGVTVNAVHPGVVRTDIFNNLPAIYKNCILYVIDLLFKTSEEGVQTTLHLCSAPELESASGGYYAECKPGKVAKIVNDSQITEQVWNESLAITTKG